MKRYYDAYWDESGLGQEMATAHGAEGTINRPLRKLLATHIRDGASCLDVGCGDGRRVGLTLRGHGCTYVGIDISSRAVAAGQALGLDCRTVEDLVPLPFEPESFDALVCVEVLEHLFRPDLAVAEMRRVLKPGGILIATVPNSANWARRVELSLFGVWNTLGDNRRLNRRSMMTVSLDRPWADPHIRFFTRSSFRRMLLRAGFTNVAVGGHEGNLGWAIRVMAGTRGRVLEDREASIPHPLRRIWPSLFGLRLHAVAHA